MKSLTMFLKYVLNDLGTWCCTSTVRDLKTVTNRFEHEGLSFLTITLSNFASDFERSLELGYVSPTLFPGFQRRGGLPQFLGGFLDQVFCRSTGCLLDIPSVTAIWAVRQFCRMFSKIELPCSDARISGAFSKYVECEQDIIESDAFLASRQDLQTEFERLAVLLWGDVLSTVDSDIYYDNIKPKHGPGSTADRISSNQKWNLSTWTDRLEEVFPHWVHLSSSWLISMDELDHVDILEPGTEMPVRVITVPKTMKTPRIIAIEPTCMQYMQQGILSSISEAVERSDNARMLISWESQVPNRQLALEGSVTGSLATLDLSEASDRVSVRHVELLAKVFPNFRQGVLSTRSSKADVPGHGILDLAKFASMGSALTFPLESMVFCTIVFMGIQQELNHRLTKEDIKSFFGKVRVYGDDIIVPVDFVLSVIEHLEAFGLKVNSDKSFWNGKFRESCGGDYYDGEDVSITRVRRLFPTSRTDVPEIESTVSLRNHLYQMGMWESAGFLDDLIKEIIPFPIVEDTSQLLGRFSFLDYMSEKTDPYTQAPLVRGARVRRKPPADRLDGYGALLKCFTSFVGDLPISGSDHLARAGRPRSANIKIGYGQPF